MPVSKIRKGAKRRPSPQGPQGAMASMAKPACSNLSLAASKSDLHSAMSLLARGAHPDKASPPYLDNPLSMACAKKDSRMAKLLLGAGADANLPSHAGEPPLALASREGLLELAVTLCAAGADPLAPRLTDGKCALDLAKERCDKPMADLLGSALARIQPTPANHQRKARTPNAQR